MCDDCDDLISQDDYPEQQIDRDRADHDRRDDRLEERGYERDRSGEYRRDDD